MFVIFPIVWFFNIKPLIALSITEAEHISLSAALREVIAINNLLSELRSQNFPIPNTVPRVICKVFEDNKVFIEIATDHKNEREPNTYQSGYITSDHT